MSDETVNLALPYILPSQAQKHVTHNEALQKLDALVQLVVKASLSAPPASPEEGDCHAVSPGATGAWAGKDGKLAFRQDASWIFLTPQTGWRAFFLQDDSLRIHDGSGWHPFAPALLGINTTADTTNRLAVSAAASLFSHAGTGHQIKVNKAASGHTASLLFQSGWSGRAEMGLAGTDTFEIKVSPDGAAWASALQIAGTGAVLTPQRPLVRATLGGGLFTPPNGSQTGFNTLLLDQGAFALGEAVPGGTGSRLLVPVAGPYLICLNVEANAAAAFSATVKVNGTTSVTKISSTAPSTADFSASSAGLALLQAGDWLSLEHTGTAALDFANTKTELMAVML